MDQRKIIEGIGDVLEAETTEVVTAVQSDAEKALEVLLGTGSGTLVERAKKFKKKFDVVERLGGLSGISLNAQD